LLQKRFQQIQVSIESEPLSHLPGAQAEMLIVFRVPHGTSDCLGKSGSSHLVPRRRFAGLTWDEPIRNSPI
jgi:hypothetical protein